MFATVENNPIFIIKIKNANHLSSVAIRLIPLFWRSKPSWLLDDFIGVFVYLTYAAINLPDFLGKILLVV